MRTLFIDTSTSDVSIAIISDGKVIASKCEFIPNAHSIYTVKFIDELLKEVGLIPNDIETILVVTGPGSFTGVRIGVTIAKTYAYLRKIKIVEVSSLKMLSLSSQHDYCLSLIDAKHDNYYLGLYDKDNNDVIREQFNTKENVLKLIEKYNPVIVSSDDIVLDNIKVNKQVLDIENVVLYYQDKSSVNVHLVVPNYLKLPQALEEQK